MLTIQVLDLISGIIMQIIYARSLQIRDLHNQFHATACTVNNVMLPNLAYVDQ